MIKGETRGRSLEALRASGSVAARGADRQRAPGNAMAAAEPAAVESVTHRRYVPYSHAHYGGNLVDGAYVLGLFGDVATEVCIRLDGDEGLLASFSEVQFRAPVRAGDVLEITAAVIRVGRRSRDLAFEARVTCRADPERGPSAAQVLSDPLVAVTATGTVVVPL